MKNLEDNEVVKLEFDEVKSTLYHYWKLGTANVQWERIRTEFSKFIEASVQLKPKNILVDERNMRHAYTPQEQEWIDNNSAPRVAASGVKKLAIIISKDGFVELATETLMDDKHSKAINTRFFDSIESAESWFSS